MRKTLSTIVLALGLVLVGAPAATADGCCAPAADALATQDPGAYSSLTTTVPCRTHRSVDCYWDVIGHTGEWGQSYFVLRVGNERCVKFWDARYNRQHGHCSPIRHHRHHR